MIRASLDIVLRTGINLVVNFPDDEAVNAVVERLKKTLLSDGIFSVEVTTPDGVSLTHYLPAREIVRFAVSQHPRVAAPV